MSFIDEWLENTQLPDFAHHHKNDYFDSWNGSNDKINGNSLYAVKGRRNFSNELKKVQFESDVKIENDQNPFEPFEERYSHGYSTRPQSATVPFQNSSAPNTSYSNQKAQVNYSVESRSKVDTNLHLDKQCFIEESIDVPNFEDKENMGILSPNTLRSESVICQDIDDLQIDDGDVPLVQETDDDCDEDVDGESLILEELPKFQIDDHCTDSLDISTQFLTSVEGELTFFQNMYSIDDPTFLPRYFQGHKLKKTSLISQNEPYVYLKNKKCPSSSNSQYDETSLVSYRYSRKSKFKSYNGSKDYESIEVLCRFCRGQNWLSKSQYDEHLILSHGIIPISTPHEGHNLLPYPKSLFIAKSHYFKDFHVNCPKCMKWIKLGHDINEDILTQDRSTGLYYNYFLHFLSNHQDTLPF